MIRFKTFAFASLIIPSIYTAKANSFAQADVKDIALLPVQNEYRNVLSLDGIWKFKTDAKEVGEEEKWQNGLTDSQPIAVPGSWNEQIVGERNHLGHSWYETETYVPHSWRNERVMLRIGSAVYAAKIWVNGLEVGQHEGAHLPFAFEINDYIKWGEANRITIDVENKLKNDRVPTGNVNSAAFHNYPKTNYDFFPYSGLHRSVQLYTVPKESAIRDVTITTDFKGITGWINVKIEKMGSAQTARILVEGEGQKPIVQTIKFKDSSEQSGKILIPSVHLWSPEHPYLYKVTVVLQKDGRIIDEYSCRTGVRTVKVSGDHILLNGNILRIKGFGKHEDFPIFGRGVAHPVTVKDFQMMKWTGANAFRTSHYPYDESVYDIADELGFLVIDEIPTVGLFFYDRESKVMKRQKQCLQYLDEMIARDKNHPSIIMWCVANEPMPKDLGGGGVFTGIAKEGETEENRLAKQCLTELVNAAKEKDPTRLSAFVGVMGGPTDWLAACDVTLINRYFGWYTNIGDLPAGIKMFTGEMDHLHKLYPRPVIVTEFGADCIAGFHSEDIEALSEEFQQAFINGYLDGAAERDYVAGMMVWNFADFRTGQAIIRFQGRNQKGVFTWDRKPKMAAHLLRQRWANKEWGKSY